MRDSQSGARLLGAEWERAGVGRRGQMRQCAVVVAVVVPLGCEYVVYQRLRRLVLLVVVLDVVGSIARCAHRQRLGPVRCFWLVAVTLAGPAGCLLGRMLS
jgi:hypothetical protein